MSEFQASGRQSRISMLVEGKLDNVKIGGYYEDGLPLCRHHVQQQPEQQLRPAPAPVLGASGLQ